MKNHQNKNNESTALHLLTGLYGPALASELISPVVIEARREVLGAVAYELLEAEDAGESLVEANDRLAKVARRLGISGDGFFASIARSGLDRIDEEGDGR